MSIPSFQQTPIRPSSPKRNKGDVAVVGFLTAVLVPILALIILYFLWFGTGTFGQYMAMFFDLNNPIAMNNASKAVSLAMIANLLPFYFFLNKKKYLTVKGVLVGSALFVLLIILYKFVWQ